jgi:hypothetical protein
MSSHSGRLAEVLIEDRVFSRVVIGDNPFLGFSYYSQARNALYERKFSDAARIEEVISGELAAGARGMLTSIQCRPRRDLVLAALERACESCGIRIPTIAVLGADFEGEAKSLARANAQVGLLHGQLTDALFRKRTGDFPPEFDDLLARIRAMGLVPGVSTHNAGEVVPALAGHDAAVVNTPVNKIGWRMCPSPEHALAALAATERQVIAMKPLAMGRIAPKEGMEYVLGRPEVDMVVVGLASADEAAETIGVAG